LVSTPTVGTRWGESWSWNDEASTAIHSGGGVSLARSVSRRDLGGLEKMRDEGGRRALPVRTGNDDELGLVQHAGGKIQFGDDISSGLARGNEWGRVRRDTRRRHDDHSTADAVEVMAAEFDRHAISRKRPHRPPHGRLIHDVRGVDGEPLGCQPPCGGNAASSQPNDRHLSPTPRIGNHRIFSVDRAKSAHRIPRI
jgi:hypothetical protein